MIKQLDYKDKGLIERLPSNTVNAIKIKSLFKAYGMGYKFLTFYADEKSEIVVAVQDSAATLYLNNPAKNLEATTFLSLISSTIVSECPLLFDDYKCETGKIYSIDTQNLTPKFCLQVSNVIHSAYSVLNKVFNQSINSVNYQKWYTEISHRVRHGVSKTYTIENCGTLTLYGKVGETLSIVEFGVVEALRKRGIATKLLNHLFADNRLVKRMILYSQDSNADGFYEKTGFVHTGNWYYYEK